jgi:hypothetical protein
LREQLPTFEKMGVKVACIVQGTADEAARFCGRHGIRELCIGDPEKESYKAMGLGRTSWKEIILPSAELKRRRAEAKEAGCSVSLEGTFQKHSDVLQLPGAALVDRGGTILWLHRGTHTADLPSPQSLLEIATTYLLKSPNPTLRRSGS